MLLLSALFTLMCFTNCGDEKEEDNATSTELTGDWKLVMAKVDFGGNVIISTEEDMKEEQYMRFEGGYMYACIQKDGQWGIRRIKYSFSNGQLVDKNGLALTITKTDDTLKMNIFNLSIVDYKASTLPEEAQKLIAEKQYTEIDGFGELEGAVD